MSPAAAPKTESWLDIFNPFSAPGQSEREQLERRAGIREVVFGVQDGVLTTMGLTTGVATAAAGAAVAHTTILIAGLAGALAGMVSMGTGAYLAACAERDLKRAAIHKERAELLTQPVEEHQEMVEILMDRGVPEATAHELSRALAKYPKLWEETHIEKELGISSDPQDSPLRDGLVMGATFLMGAVVPIVPFIFLTGIPAVALSLGLSAVALLLVGVGKAWIIGQRPLIGGAQVLGVGAAAALAGYILGVLLPHLFGLRLPPA
ncbi:MAG: VIT1/CCC1 transporter family protein [Candidatus Dormibacteria bacterium]|jgi:VIT1/CCC1 family predicted Fe2+/Mn2+ transporter